MRTCGYVGRGASDTGRQESRAAAVRSALRPRHAQFVAARCRRARRVERGGVVALGRRGCAKIQCAASSAFARVAQQRLARLPLAVRAHQRPVVWAGSRAGAVPCEQVGHARAVARSHRLEAPAGQRQREAHVGHGVMRGDTRLQDVEQMWVCGIARSSAFRRWFCETVVSDALLIFSALHYKRSHRCEACRTRGGKNNVARTTDHRFSIGSDDFVNRIKQAVGLRDTERSCSTAAHGMCHARLHSLSSP